MDWGNAIVRSKTFNDLGQVTAIAMDLNLAGDFRKTKKKITWLAQPDASHSLLDVTLLDYDYLITKKKLEDTDELKDYVTPVTEFREDAFADANVKDLKKGDIMQFERKGYYIFDGVKDGRLEFIHIPDGRAASLASKAAPAAVATPVDKQAKNNSGAATPSSADPLGAPVDTKMYRVAPIYGDQSVIPVPDTKMYAVKNVYDA